MNNTKRQSSISSSTEDNSPGSYPFFVKRMIQLRQKKGLTQAELAKMVGTRQPAISRFESGSMNSTLAFLYKLGDALDVKVKVEVVKI